MIDGRVVGSGVWWVCGGDVVSGGCGGGGGVSCEVVDGRVAVVG